MKTFILAAALLASTGPVVLAQAPMSDKPISAVPPAGAAQHTLKSTSDVANGPASATQVPQKAQTAAPGSAIPPSSATPVIGQATSGPSARQNSGTSEVGNSTEGSGVLGMSGAGASATMQNGHSNNK